jgi:hypothetical protein
MGLGGDNFPVLTTRKDGCQRAGDLTAQNKTKASDQAAHSKCISFFYITLQDIPEKDNYLLMGSKTKERCYQSLEYCTIHTSYQDS